MASLAEIRAKLQAQETKSQSNNSSGARNPLRIAF